MLKNVNFEIRIIHFQKTHNISFLVIIASVSEATEGYRNILCLMVYATTSLIAIRAVPVAQFAAFKKAAHLLLIVS